MGKRNLILYPSQWAALQQLEDQQLGRVMRQALGYAFDEVEPENKEVAFLFLKAQIDVDAEKYEDKCQQSRDAARSRWMQKDANGCDRIQTDATAYGRTKRNADYAKEKEKEKDNNNEKEKENIEKNTSSFGVSTKKEGQKSFNISSYLESKGVQPAMIEAWLAIRKTKRATNTEAAMQLMEREIGKVKMTWDEVIQECVLRNWVGFKAEWILKDQVQQAAPEGQDDMDAMAKKWRQELEAMRAADGRVPGQFKDL